MTIIDKKLIKFLNYNFHVHKILQKIFKESCNSMTVDEKKNHYYFFNFDD